MKDSSKAFSRPKQTQDVVETNGSKAMIVLFNGDHKDSLAYIRYNMPCKEVARAKMFVTPERLPPTASACRFYSLRTYNQIMEWMGCSDVMAPSERGWKVEGDKLVPLMTAKSPAPDELIQMIHSNCLEGCNTLRCICRRHGLEFTCAGGHYQDGKCDNMKNAPVIDDGDEEEEEV